MADFTGQCVLEIGCGDGSLIGIHPCPKAPLVEVHQGGQTVFAEPVPEHAYQDKQQAEKVLIDIVQRGLFMVQRADVFDFRVYASSSIEPRSFLEEANAFEDSPPDKEAATWQAALAFAGLPDRCKETGR